MCVPLLYSHAIKIILTTVLSMPFALLSVLFLIDWQKYSYDALNLTVFVFFLKIIIINRAPALDTSGLPY